MENIRFSDFIGENKYEDLMDRSYLVGAHWMSFENEYEKIQHLPLTLVEVKPEGFRKYGNPSCPLYHFDGNSFQVDQNNMDKVAKAAKEMKVEVQFHLPDTEFNTSTNEEIVLTPLNREQWPLLLKRIELYHNIIKKYGFRNHLTMHPPVVEKGGRLMRGAKGNDEDVKTTNQFFKYLEDEIKREELDIQIGLENQADPSRQSKILGYRTEQLIQMYDGIGLKNVFGFTVDSGHRVLAENFSIDKLREFLVATKRKDFLTIHLHGNVGRTQYTDWHDDQHHLADIQNVVGYHRYIASISKRKTPVVFEIPTWSLSVGEMQEYIIRFWVILRLIGAPFEFS